MLLAAAQAMGGGRPCVPVPVRPRPGEDLEAFLNDNKPSILRAEQVSWIFVDRATSPARPTESEGHLNDCLAGCILALRTAYKEQQKPDPKPRAKACRDALAGIMAQAAADGVTCGKWMLFVGTEHVDAAWAQVARLTARGQLGHSSKCAPYDARAARPTRDNPAQLACTHLICCYVPDFRAAADVARVVQALHGAGLFTKTIAFKPDVLTHLHSALQDGTGLPEDVSDDERAALLSLLRCRAFPKSLYRSSDPEGYGGAALHAAAGARPGGGGQAAVGRNRSSAAAAGAGKRRRCGDAAGAVQAGRDGEAGKGGAAEAAQWPRAGDGMDQGPAGAARQLDGVGNIQRTALAPLGNVASSAGGAGGAAVREREVIDLTD